ncbi:MAG: hypothetical protein ACXWSC_06885 [Bdellovibrionota bacterium]
MSCISRTAIATLVAVPFGVVLYGRAPGPDFPHGVAALFGAFFIFLAYAGAQLCWGRVIAGGRAPWEWALWGSALFALLPATLGFFPWSAFEWWAFLLAGPALALIMERRRPAEARLLLPGQRLTVAGVALFLLAFSAAASPNPFWDSLWYHLTAARFWFEAARVHLPPHFPIAFKGGLWDYHFLWGQVLLGSPNGGGLIPAQLFGQWASVSCAIFSLLVLWEEGDLFGLSAGAALLGIAGTELFMEVSFAKNDWAVVFWSLAAFVYLRRGNFLEGAAVAGLAFTAKFTSGFFLLPLLIFETWRQPRRASWAALAFSLAASPILLRNAYITGDPFFPALYSIFPTKIIGPSWRSISYYESGSFTFSALAEKFGFLLRDSPAVPAIFLLPFARVSRAARAGAAFALISLALFWVLSGEKAEWRLAGAALVLLGAYGAEAALTIGKRLPSRAMPAVLLLLAGYVLWRFPLDWRAPSRLLGDPAERIREHVAGNAMAWVRMNAAPGSGVVTLNEQRIYYLFPFSPRRAFDDPELDSALSTATDASAAVAVLKKAGIRYVVLSAEFLDRYFDRRICDLFFALSEAQAGAVPFRTEFSRVLDLDRLNLPEPRN